MRSTADGTYSATVYLLNNRKAHKEGTWPQINAWLMAFYYEDTCVTSVTIGRIIATMEHGSITHK